MFAMRGKEYLTAVRSENGLLELHTMHFADEVRDPRHEVDNLPEKTKLTPQEVKTAEQLIGMLAIGWKPDEWHDTCEEQVKKLVEDKLAGRQIAVSTGPAPEATNVVDLMDMLRQSLDAAKGKGQEKTAAAGGSERRAPKARRTPKATGGKKSTAGSRAEAGKPAAKKRATEDLSSLTKAQLYKKATQYGIAHRSTMSRDELQKAVEEAARGQRLRSVS